MGDDFEEPSIAVKSISKTGKLVLAFSDEFIVPDDPQSLKEKTLKIGDDYKSNMEIWVTPLEEQGADAVRQQSRPLAYHRHARAWV